MRISIISFTGNGDILNKRLGSVLRDDDVIHTGHGFSKRNNSLAEWTKNAFKSSDALIFIGAAGIAVRAAAPYIRGKDKDPAVIVMDEAARFVIPVLSGHIGGANSLARRIAGEIGAQAVITTATDINGVWAADAWASENGYAVYNPEEIKHISGELLRGGSVGLISHFPVCGALPKGVSFSSGGRYGILIADTPEYPFEHTLVIIPKRITVGAGSRSGASGEEMLKLYQNIKNNCGFEDCAVESVATIDIKRGEKSIERLAEYIGCNIIYYSADELNKAEGIFNGSEFVKKVTGVDNVCERAAALRGKVIAPKTAGKGVTAAAAEREIKVVF